MSAKERESTGMTLISSTYSDDEDDEIEDVEERLNEDVAEDKEEQPIGDECSRMLSDDERFDSRRDGDATPIANGGSTPNPLCKPRPLTPQQAQIPLASPSQQPAVTVDLQRSRKLSLAIVEYGQDEVAMSPEAEEGEIMGTGHVISGEELQTANGDFQGKIVAETSQVLVFSTQETTQFSELLNSSQSDKTNNAVDEAEFVGLEEVITVVDEVQADVDPLDNFLPPPPSIKCSDELQKRINKFLELKRGGKSYNAEVRNKKEYRNPDFLRHAVTYQDIDQIGSCFGKDVFDPHGYDKSDYYDEIEADMKREMERKEQEKKKSQKVEFVAGGMQPGILVPAPKVSVSVAGVTIVAASALPSVPASVDAVPKDGRQSKKSKWDKVDGDRRNPLPPGGQNSLSAVGTHAAILSAANAAGTGYTAFAQQRRKEAEEKRSSERRERRS